MATTRKTPATTANKPKVLPPENIRNPKSGKFSFKSALEKPVEPERLDAALETATLRVCAEMSDTIWAKATEMVLHVLRLYLREELMKEEKENV